MSAPTFKQRCCAKLGWAADEFDRRLFLRCRFAGARWLVALALLLNPSFFQNDFELIRTVAEVTTVEELESELDDFRVLRPTGGWLRKCLKLRISTTKLQRFAKKILAPASEDTPSGGAPPLG